MPIASPPSDSIHRRILCSIYFYSTTFEERKQTAMSQQQQKNFLGSCVRCTRTMKNRKSGVSKAIWGSVLLMAVTATVTNALPEIHTKPQDTTTASGLLYPWLTRDRGDESSPLLVLNEADVRNNDLDDIFISRIVGGDAASVGEYPYFSTLNVE